MFVIGKGRRMKNHTYLIWVTLVISLTLRDYTPEIANNINASYNLIDQVHAYIY